MALLAVWSRFSFTCMCVRTHRASQFRACVCVPTGLLIYVLVCAYPQGFSSTCLCVRTHRASHLRACVCVPTGLLIYVRVCAYPQGFPSHAHAILNGSILGSPEAAASFLTQFSRAVSVGYAASDLRDLCRMARRAGLDVQVGQRNRQDTS